MWYREPLTNQNFSVIDFAVFLKQSEVLNRNIETYYFKVFVTFRSKRHLILKLLQDFSYTIYMADDFFPLHDFLACTFLIRHLV